VDALEAVLTSLEQASRSKVEETSTGFEIGYCHWEGHRQESDSSLG